MYEIAESNISNNADSIQYGQDPARISYYLNSVLLALKPVKIWSNAGVARGGVVKYTVQAGNKIGRIYSWVKDANGFLWLQLVAPDTPDNKMETAKLIGYTPFLEGYFDKDLARQTALGTSIINKQESIKNLDTPFDFSILSGFLNKIIMYVIIAVVIYFTIKHLTK